MGIKYGREYEEIIRDLSAAMAGIETCHEFIGMPKEQWEQMDEQARMECLHTLADDVFFGLGADRVLEIGGSTVTWLPKQHVIKVEQNDTVVHVVHLT